MEKVLLTQEGYNRLESELHKLRSVERPAVIQAIAEARAHGDLSENAEYDAAKEKQGYIEAKIAALEAMFSRAEVVDIKSFNGEQIKFGATVKLIDEETEEEQQYKVVSDYEADSNRNMISTSSPLARAMIGKKKGDSIEVTTPRGIRYYEVLAVEFK
ncbi:MAG: transcription elongation factor GreA [Proteobacteria bacterium]|nr:transcription elongation factor GreA [Pseudomonadota bacterium]